MKYLAAVLLLWCSPVVAAPQDAVGSMRGCTCVVISADGWALTAEHCPYPETFPVDIGGRTVQARKIHEPQKDGIDQVEVLKLSGGPFPFVPVASEPVQRGDYVQSWGFPIVNGEPTFTHIAGQVNYVDPETGHITGDFKANGGHSGGPLFNSRGEVCGILSTSDRVSITGWIGLPEIQRAMQFVNSGEPSETPVVWMLTAQWCGSCQAFKRDIAAGKYPGVRFEFADVDTPAGKAKVREIEQATGQRVTSIPTLWPEGSGTFYVVGQKSNRLGVWDWLKQTLRLPLTIVEDISGERQPAPGGWQPVPRGGTEPFPDPESLDWADVTIIGLGAQQGVGELRGKLRAIGLGAARGTVERLIRDATDGRATLHLVLERLTPARYEAVCRAAGVDPALGHVLVLVKQQAHGLRGFAREKIVSALLARAPDSLKDLPVDLVPQLTSPDDYGAILAALRTEEPEPDPPADSEPGVEPEGEPEPTAPPADKHEHEPQSAAISEPEFASDLPTLTWIDGLWSLLAGPLLTARQWMEDRLAGLKQALRETA